eukprot:m.215931 g.215931  ORF g.215931 m.215931 type:complete len:998 (-) comp33197_c0_seq1:96-3089(-)
MAQPPPLQPPTHQQPRQPQQVQPGMGQPQPQWTNGPNQNNLTQQMAGMQVGGPMSQPQMQMSQPPSQPPVHIRPEVIQPQMVPPQIVQAQPRPMMGGLPQGGGMNMGGPPRNGGGRPPQMMAAGPPPTTSGGMMPPPTLPNQQQWNSNQPPGPPRAGSMQPPPITQPNMQLPVQPHVPSSTAPPPLMSGPPPTGGAESPRRTTSANRYPQATPTRAPQPGVVAHTPSGGPLHPPGLNSQPGMPPRDLGMADPAETVDLMSSRTVLPPAPLRAPVPMLPESHRRRNCSSKVVRCTLTNVPTTQALLSKSRLPFGITIFPFGAEKIPVVESTIITRCRICRTYMNPFATFLSHGRRWRCNMCFRVHDLPTDFDFDPVQRKHIERSERPELNYSSVEYIAPHEYMVRPPQPCIYVFLIDVSAPAVESGMVEVVAQSILAQIESLTGDQRTKVAFITYDHQLHFYNLQDSLGKPQMMVVPDIEELFLPCPNDLVVNLEDSMDLVKQLLESLPTLFAKSQSVVSCLGEALKAARMLIEHIGGRITIFQTIQPNIGEGKISRVEDKSKRNTADEYQMMAPESDFYKQFSVDASRAQIGIDLFTFPAGFIDLATLGQIAKFGAGMSYHYPSFHKRNVEQRKKAEKEIAHYLTRPLGLEAVLRVRCTKGLVMNSFHGHFFVRSADLLSLPNVSPDNSYSFQLAIEEDLPETQPYCYFQVALLYTSSNGERRIRVHTLALPTTNSLADTFSGADVQTLIGMLGKMAIDRALATKLSDARDAIINVVVDCLSAYRKHIANSGSSSLVSPGSLRALPLLALALMKNAAFTNEPIEMDARSHAITLMKVLPMWELKDLIYPRMYPLHNMDGAIGIRDKNNRLPMPVVLQLSSEHFERGGLYLMHNGLYLLLYVQKSSSPELLKELFGVDSYTNLRNGPMELPKTGAPLSDKVKNIVKGLRSCHPRFLVLIVVKEDSNLRDEFLKHLFEDKMNGSMSYHEMLNSVQSKMK